jgi:hypothetical protein
MLANKIQFGKEYAVNYKGALHSLRVTEMHNIRTGNHNATNYVVGSITTAEPNEIGMYPTVKFQASDILDEVEKYRELVEEKARQKRETDARIEAATAKKELAATLLAKAIGVPVILTTKAGNYAQMAQEAHVSASSYSGIVVDAKAFDALIVYLQHAGVTVGETVDAAGLFKEEA